MRKWELALVVVLVATGSTWWSRQSQPSSPEPSAPTVAATALPRLVTASGRYEILAPPYSLAGIAIGFEESTVRRTLGQPSSESEKEKETHGWVYERDGEKLRVTFLENRVIAIGGNGQWSFEAPNSLPASLCTQSEDSIIAHWGQPARDEANLLVYQCHPGELTLYLNPSHMVEQFAISGEVKPL